MALFAKYRKPLLNWLAEAERHFASKVGKISVKELGHAHDRFEWRKAEVIAADHPLTKGHKAFIRYFMTSKLFAAKDASFPPL